MDHVITKTNHWNQHMTYKGSICNSSPDTLVNVVFLVFYKVTLVTWTFDLVNTKQIGACPFWNQTACEIWNLCVNSSQDSDRKPFFTIFHFLTKTNLQVNYESSVINYSQDNERKPFGLPTDGRPKKAHLLSWYSKTRDWFL